MRNHIFASSILREYDIRGVYDEDLSIDDARALGYALADKALSDNHKIACIGCDGRHSSPALYEALTGALAERGMRVLGIGECASPELYYAVLQSSAGVGVMITGSHAGAEVNGFKITYGGKPFFGADIQSLAVEAGQADWQDGGGGTGEVIDCSMRSEYMERLLEEFSHVRGLRVAFDPGNGALGWVLAEILPRLFGDFVLINGEVDGSFPSHAPDPSRAENLQQLREVVLREGCDFGVAFDGDGDRLGVIDDGGVVLFSDDLLPLYAELVLRANRGCAIIADVKTSDSAFGVISSLGGKPIMSAVGHSIIKQRMLDEGALLGVEMSGHIFFADRYYGYDDALYAALRLCEVVIEGGKPLSALRQKYPSDESIPECRLAVAESDKFALMDRIKAYVEGRDGREGDIISIDGLRVGIGGGWWLIRASNTEAVLSIRSAGKDRDSLMLATEDLLGVLERFDVDTTPIRALLG